MKVEIVAPTKEIHDAVAEKLGIVNDTCELIDITGRIGPLLNSTDDIEAPMYSYNGPSSIVWNGIANGLLKRGWSERRIFEWLQSKQSRWALDSELGDKLWILATQYAKEIE